MTKWIIAALMTTGMFAATASSSQPAATTETADVVATGTCSYTCSSNGKTYLNRTQCRAACSGVCTIEVC
ncbi:MAG: hypothetical protein WKG01_06760 [Kofleriaceae bacterium]